MWPRDVFSRVPASQSLGEVGRQEDRAGAGQRGAFETKRRRASTGRHYWRRTCWSTAAYLLLKAGRGSVVFESDAVVGGISRTVEREGWRFDIGGHRFFTKVQPVEDLWHEILPDDDFLLRPRMSRIYYDGKFFDYPLKAANVLRNLGLVEASQCLLSYAWAASPAQGPGQL